ncbi:hypothetical protein ACTXK0_01435 [Corynebacterium variabile]
MTAPTATHTTDPFIQEMIADYVADCRRTAQRTTGPSQMFWNELADRLSV